jgi:NADPH-dependent 2,4-dienoyl-CoA reductase/sulfur reductase-like enzyme
MCVDHFPATKGSSVIHGKNGNSKMEGSITMNEKQTQEADSYDLIILGGGPAGGAAAEAALSLGARVAVVERDRLGGT